MILLLDTSTPDCRLTLVTDEKQYKYEWHAGRELARNLLSYIRDALNEHDAEWSDITGLGVFRGPGSFTGLRIGMAVLNTIADAQNISIVGTEGDAWQEQAIERLKDGANDNIVLPLYDRPANITKPRK